MAKEKIVMLKKNNLIVLLLIITLTFTLITTVSASDPENITDNNNTTNVTNNIQEGIYAHSGEMDTINFTKLNNAGIKHIYIYEGITSYSATKVQKFLDTAHANNITVHIVVRCFYNTTSGKWVDARNTDMQNYILNKIRSHITNYDIDGIQLDYIRYPGTAYKYSGSVAAITNFVGKVRTLIDSLNPDIIFSAALMPDEVLKTSGSYYAGYYYGQDFKALAEYLDILMPMTYEGNYKKNNEWLTNITTKIINLVNNTDALVWPTITGYVSDKNLTKITYTELCEDINSTITGGAHGYAIFRYYYVIDEFFEKGFNGNKTYITTQPIGNESTNNTNTTENNTTNETTNNTTTENKTIINTPIIQAVYLHSDEYNTVDFAKLRNAGINTIFIYEGVLSYNTALVNEILNDAHANNITVHIIVSCFKNGDIWTDPKLDSVQQAILTKITNYITNFNIDGIQLNNLRVSGYQSKYQSEATVTAITEFTSKVKNLINKNNPNIVLSAILMPDEILTPIGNKYIGYEYAEDYAALAEYLDVIVPLFDERYNRNPTKIITTLNKITDSTENTDVTICPAILSYIPSDTITRLSYNQLVTAINTSFNNGATGYALDRYYYVNNVFFTNGFDVTPFLPVGNTTLTISVNHTIVNGTLYDITNNRTVNGKIRYIILNSDEEYVDSGIGTAKNGKYIINLPISMKTGEGNITVFYENTTASTLFTMPFIESATANKVTSKEDNTNIPITGTYTSNNDSENLTITLKIKGTTITQNTNLTDNKFNFTIPNTLAPATYTLEFYNGNKLLTTTTWTINPKLPDLIITSVSKYGNYYYYVTIKNIGEKASGTTYLKVWYSSKKYKTVKISPLSVGASKRYKVYFYRYSLHKRYKKYAQINYRPHISESNTANNRVTFYTSYQRYKADLIITKIRRSGRYYYYTVKNQGQATSSKTTLRMSYYKKGRKYSKSTSLKALSVGASTTVRIYFYAYSAHRYYYKYAAPNPSKSIVESNYANNQKKFKL